MIAIQRTYMSLGICLLSVIICCASDTVSADVPANSRCLAKKYKSLLNSSDDIEDLNIDVPVNIAFDVKQKKRFILYLNSPGPLYITFSQNVSRSIYFNQTTNLSRNLKPDLREILLPCALSGQYDLFVRARQRGSIKVEAHADHPKSNWNLLNQTKQINIRSQNRVGKRQMVIKWTRSKSDVHAVNFCLVINAKRPQTNFCAAVNDFVVGSMQKGNCFTGSWTNYIWKPERVKEIDPQITNVICTGSRTQQVLRQLTPNTTYFVDIFGVHTRRDNLTFHIVTKEIKFERTHPKSLRENALTVEKISGLSTVSIVSFKVPADSIRSPSTPQLRYLILPCGGSEVNAKVLKQGKVVAQGHGIYMPTYINVNNAQAGGRYIIRINASNDDEVLRANKVGLAVTTGRTFANLPELPENITVFEIRSRKTCKSATIAWYASPETRPIRYCIRVYNTNRCSVDSTNYCMDFRKSIKDNRQFYEMGCLDRSKPPKQIETYDIFNLTPGSRYLFYVTVRLLDGRPLPYQSLPVRISHQCHNELYDSRESTAYY